MTATLAPLPDSSLRLFDDFTGPLDRAVWTPKVDKAPQRSGVMFRDDPATVTVQSSCLNLTTRTSSKPGVWFGGEVTTLGRLELTYGRVEVKAQLPQCAAPGLQQTFWLWPVDDLKYGPWPGSGEIDFAEFYSLWPAMVVPFIHYDLARLQPVTTYRTVNPQAGFHRYQLDWRPGVITIAVDDQVILTDTYRPSNCLSPAPFDQPMFLVLTQTVGQGRNAPAPRTALPATTRVDWVKVWK